jgi:hypothetical protein
MRRLPTIKIGFDLTGDEFLEEDVSTKLGLNSDEFRSKDDWPDAIKENKDRIDLPYWYKPRTVWCVDICEEHSYAVSVQFEKMIDLLEGKENAIKEICEELNLIANFQIVINMEAGDRPEMILTKEILHLASSLNAEIGFDMYIFDDEDTEEL